MTDSVKENGTKLPHQLAEGTLLQNRYRLIRVLGEGGFGITYEGWDETLEVRVAIKEYFPKSFVTRHRKESDDVTIPEGEPQSYFEKGKSAFLTEARMLARLQNDPSIVSVSNYFEENQTAYIVMEFLEGRDLKDILEERGTFTFEETFRLLEPVMISLQRVHDSGLIHRDISPSNIRVLPDGTVKLLDFGASRQYNLNYDVFSSILFKRGYSPEEQYRSRGEQGPWTDVYALSATMYHMLTGFPPDDAGQRVLLDEVKRPSELGVLIPKDAETVLMKGLSVQSADRYQSVREMTEAFQACLENNEVSKTSPKTRSDRLPFLSIVPFAGLMSIFEMGKRTKRKRFSQAGILFLSAFILCLFLFSAVFFAKICSLLLKDNGINNVLTEYFDHGSGLSLLAIPVLLAAAFWIARIIYTFSVRKDYARYRAAILQKEAAEEVPRPGPKAKRSLIRWKRIGCVPLVFGFSGMHMGRKLNNAGLKRMGAFSLLVAFALITALCMWVDAENSYLVGWRFASALLWLSLYFLIITCILHAVHLAMELLTFPDFRSAECIRFGDAFSRYPNLKDAAWRHENSRWRIWTYVPFIGGIGLILAGKRIGRKTLVREGILLLIGNICLSAICAALSYIASVSRPVIGEFYIVSRNILPAGLVLLWFTGIYAGISHRFDVLLSVAEILGPYYSRAEKEIAEDHS